MRYLLLFIFCLPALLSLTPPSAAQDKKKPPTWSDRKDRFGDPLPVGAVARIGTARYRLMDRAEAVLSPDGKLLVACARSGDAITVWELPAWNNRLIIRGRDLDKANPPEFQKPVFSADGRLLVTIDNQKSVLYFLDTATGKALKKLPVGNKKGSAFYSEWTVSRDLKTLVLLLDSSDEKRLFKLVQVWDLTTDRMLKSFEIPLDEQNRINDGHLCGVSASGRWMALDRLRESRQSRRSRRSWSFSEHYLEIWDLTTGKIARKIEPEIDLEFVFSPDSKWLVGTDGRSALRIYDAATGAEKHNIRLRRDGVTSVHFSPEGKSFYAGHYNGRISQWDLVTGEPTASHDAPPGVGHLQQLAFTPTGKMLALGQMIDALTLWDVTTGKALSPLDLPASSIHSLTFSDQGELFIGCDADYHAWWHPRTATRLRDLKLEPAVYDLGNILKRINFEQQDRGHINPGGMTRLASLSTTGQFLVHSDGGGGISLFDAKTGKLLYDDDATNHDASISFFAGDTRAASTYDRKIRIWNARTGRDVDRYDLPLKEKERASQFTASPSGMHFAIAVETESEDGRSGRTILWDAAHKRIIREWPVQHSSQPLAFAPDDRWLAVAPAEERLLMTRVGFTRADFNLPLPGEHKSINLLVFSPDGRQLACVASIPSASEDDSRERAPGRIYIYEFASKKIRLQIAGHADAISCLGYAHDSGLLASGSTDTTVLVWNAGLRAFAEKQAAKDATAVELDDWHSQMAGADAKSAFQAMIKLAQAPKQAVKCLEEKLPPAKKPDTGGKTISQWVQDLASSQFAVRGKASDMLKKIGASVEPDLRAALPNAKDVETKRRIEELLEHFASQEWTQEEIAHVRAVEVVEAIGTPEARALLTRWAGGAAGAVLTLESSRALKRFN